MSEKVDSVKELANNLNFQCEIFYHEQSGKSTEEAVKATGIDSTHIIKCLLLKSKSQEYIGAIIRGSDRLDFKILEKFLGCKELQMASVEEIQEKLGFEPGGIPVIIFFEKGIRTFVDNHVLSLEYVVGSSGTPFSGMKFNPKQLIEKLNYIPANIVKVQK